MTVHMHTHTHTLVLEILDHNVDNILIILGLRHMINTIVSARGHTTEIPTALWGLQDAQMLFAPHKTNCCPNEHHPCANITVPLLPPPGQSNIMSEALERWTRVKPFVASSLTQCFLACLMPPIIWFTVLSGCQKTSCISLLEEEVMNWADIKHVWVAPHNGPVVGERSGIRFGWLLGSRLGQGWVEATKFVCRQLDAIATTTTTAATLVFHEASCVRFLHYLSLFS